MTPTLTDILRLIDRYHQYLGHRDVAFAGDGLPIPERSWYLNNFPERIVPYKDRNNRKYVSDQRRTVLCHYCADKFIFRRMQHPLNDVADYKRFMGTIGADLTVTEDMDIEWQRAIILLNRLYDAFLATNGIKLIQNLRIGSPATLDVLTVVPEGVLAASGTLGCPLTKPDDLSYTLKLNVARPSGVMQYGRRDKFMEQQLDKLGIPHQRYDDIHTLYKTRRQKQSETR